MGTESTSYYLYGRGVIGTKTDNWAYILQDGLGSTRQLATHEGVIAMSVAYTPWGDVLEYYGSGALDFGYLGGMYDDATGLIYLGSGQYYDPVTGRMLTRGAGQSNPYKPGAYDPAGMMVAPLAVLGLVLGKKKKRGKWDSLLVLLVVGMVVGMSVSACGPKVPAPTPPPHQPPTGTPSPGPGNGKNVSPETTNTPTPTPTYTCTVSPTATLTPLPTATPVPTFVPLNENLLRGRGEEGRHGKGYYAWYKDCWDNKNWWWWKTHNTFSVWDFITLIMHMEINTVGNPKGYPHMHTAYDYYMEAVVRQSYAWCAHVSPNHLPNEPEAALNWIAEYNESTKFIHNQTKSIALVNDDQLYYAGKIVDAMQNPDNYDKDWSNGFSKYRPYGVGNASMFDAGKLAHADYLGLIFWRSGDGDGEKELIIPMGCGSYILTEPNDASYNWVGCSARK